jgi:AAA15 family ATPase/GTPase
MLSKIEISNFKSFSENFVFDLNTIDDFDFNQDCIKNGIINKSVIYGQNGSGKSNLGFAIFDLVSHLTDRQKYNGYSHNYLNGNSTNTVATFKFTFNFENNIVEYIYTKKDYQTLISEILIINKETFAYVDKSKSKIFQTSAKGAENLNKNLGNSNISIILYLFRNSILEENTINAIFKKFKDFVDGMLYFRSLDDKLYIGFEHGVHSIATDIVQNNNLKDFENFLNSAGVECKLVAKQVSDGFQIYFHFNRVRVEFFHIASSGTKALALFYFWYQRLKNNQNCSLLFIDEFDAFYHHALSRTIIEKLKELTDIQIILTTHNTSIISNDLLRPDCYFIMDKKQIRSLTQCTDRELREGHNIEKMYRANSFE